MFSTHKKYVGSMSGDSYSFVGATPADQFVFWSNVGHHTALRNANGTSLNGCTEAIIEAPVVTKTVMYVKRGYDGGTMSSLSRDCARVPVEYTFEGDKLIGVELVD